MRGLSAIFIFSLSALVLLLPIWRSYLTGDEAHTACLARNTLKFGFPTAYDGKNLITIPLGNQIDYIDGYYIDTWHPWLQYYITAISFALFKEGTASARLPHAIFAILSVILLFYITKRYINRNFAIVCALLFLFSEIFINHAYRCRYYSLAVFFTLSFLISYLYLIEGRRFSIASFIITGVLLYHSNVRAFLSAASGIFLYHLIFERVNFLRFFLSYLGILPFTLPWTLFVSNIGDPVFPHRFTIIIDKGFLYFWVMNATLFPTILAFFFPFMVKNQRRTSLRLFYISLFICVVHFLILILLLPYHPYRDRYVINLTPYAAILMAFFVFYLRRINRALACLIFCVLLFTNCANTSLPVVLRILNFKFESLYPLIRVFYDSETLYTRLSGYTNFIFEFIYFKSPIFDHIKDIVRPVLSPSGAVVRFLNAHATSEDTIMSNMDWEVFNFYTKLRVVNRLYPWSTLPDPTWCPQHKVKWVAMIDRFARLSHEVDLKDYKEIELQYDGGTVLLYKRNK